MINPFREIDWSPSLTKRREFGRTVFIGFVLIALVFLLAAAFGLPLLRRGLLAGLSAGALLGLLSWILPQIARPFYLIWHLFGASIGIVTSNLLLAASYYLILTPFALYFRLIGRDSLKRRFDSNVASYWEETERNVDPERYFRQF